MYRLWSDAFMIVLEIILIGFIIYGIMSSNEKSLHIVLVLLSLLLMIVLAHLVFILRRVFYYSGWWFYC